LLESKRVANNHRGNFDIIADILGASNGGAKKTNLMYRCNLSFRQLKSYSHFLVKTGMIRVKVTAKSEAVVYDVTEKGKEFLRAYRGLKALMK
jgi:predicted transcriptional regulator